MFETLIITLILYGIVNAAILITATTIRAAVIIAQLPLIAAAAGLEEVRTRRQKAGARELHEMAYFTGELVE